MFEGDVGISVILLAVCSIGLLATVPVGMSALLHGNIHRLARTVAGAVVLFAIALIAALLLGAQPFEASILN